jgi:hypothetical protein
MTRITWHNALLGGAVYAFFGKPSSSCYRRSISRKTVGQKHFRGFDQAMNVPRIPLIGFDCVPISVRWMKLGNVANAQLDKSFRVLPGRAFRDLRLLSYLTIGQPSASCILQRQIHRDFMTGNFISFHGCH